MQNPNTKTAMSRDSIFRIYSMTKPLKRGGVDASRRGEDQVVRPIPRTFPSLQTSGSLTNADTAKDPTELQTHAAKNPIRVLDLLMHTSGFTYGFFKPFPGADRSSRCTSMAASTISISAMPSW